MYIKRIKIYNTNEINAYICKHIKIKREKDKETKHKKYKTLTNTKR